MPLLESVPAMTEPWMVRLEITFAVMWPEELRLNAPETLPPITSPRIVVGPSVPSHTVKPLSSDATANNVATDPNRAGIPHPRRVRRWSR